MRLAISCLLSFLLWLPVSAYDWSSTLRQVEKSLVRLNHDAIDEDGDMAHYTCTGFVINEREQYVMTDYHCLGESLIVDGVTTFVVKGDEELDLAIVRNLAAPKPRLAPSRKVSLRGLPLAAVGFGMAGTAPTSRTGAIMAPRFTWREDPEVYFLTDFGFIGGMSGGPVVDSEGRVLSICQKTDPDTETGLGRPLTVLRAFAGKLWD